MVCYHNAHTAANGEEELQATRNEQCNIISGSDQGQTGVQICEASVNIKVLPQPNEQPQQIVMMEHCQL